MSEVRDVYQNQSLEMSAKQVNIKDIKGADSIPAKAFVNFNLFQMCFKWRMLSYPCFFLGNWKSNVQISKLEMVLRL